MPDAPSLPTLTVDPERVDWPYLPVRSGIYVRAQHPATKAWDSYDIAHLDRPSLLTWLRMGGDARIAEHTVLILLGHSREGL